MDELIKAAKSLLEFVKTKYPDDFAPGGRGFVCPHHVALDEAVKRAEEQCCDRPDDCQVVDCRYNS